MKKVLRHEKVYGINNRTFVINLMNHNLTSEQVSSLKERYGNKTVFVSQKEFLTKDEINFVKNTSSNWNELVSFANKISNKIRDMRFDTSNWLVEPPVNQPIIIGPVGSPAFWHIMCVNLAGINQRVLYANSERVSVESTQEDGSIVKKSTFVFKGWIEI